jgi:uncharacterized protein YggE
MISPSKSSIFGPGRSGLLAAVVLLSSCAPVTAQTAPPPPAQPDKGTIKVTGQANISVPADLVRIGFSVETEASSAGEATEENAVLMESVVDALRGADIPGLDLETFGYVLRPEYEVARDGSGTRTITGYRVQNNLRASFPNVDAAGEILDLAVNAGANRVANLQFEASDTKAARMEALRMAVLNAREQADAIASAMGVGLGIALEVQGGVNAPNPLAPAGIMLRATAEATTPVEAGDQMVAASVTITYRILEGGS